jgi:hypothetical protein
VGVAAASNKATFLFSVMLAGRVESLAAASSTVSYFMLLILLCSVNSNLGKLLPTLICLSAIVMAILFIFNLVMVRKLMKSIFFPFLMSRSFEVPSESWTEGFDAVAELECLLKLIPGGFFRLVS